MEYFIGIDGGGTKSKYVVADKDLNVIYRCEGGPTNFLMLGLKKTVENVFNSLQDCYNNAGIEKDKIKGILLGTAGAGRKTDAENFEKKFYGLAEEKKLHINSFRVESDATITLEGAFSGKPGSILIAGTGSIIYGKNDKSNIFRAGGYGRLIGDEGGGYSIGRKGFNALSKYFDGNGTDFKFFTSVSNEFNIKNRDDLINKLYTEKLDIASAAPIIIRCAEEKDPVCMDILNSESDELINLISSMKSNFKTNEMNLCLLGGLLDNKNYYSDLLKRKIPKKFPEIKIKQPDYPPEIGAVILIINSH